MKYIAMLRGINIGSHKQIKMADLRALCEKLGFVDVVTYIQSGNVIFSTDKSDHKQLEVVIERAIHQKYAFDVPVIIRTRTEIEAFIKDSPFGEVDMANEGTKFLATFITVKPSQEALNLLQSYVHMPEKVVLGVGGLYLHCPGGYGRSKISNNFIESKLKVKATTRNWKTVCKLCELAEF